MLRILVATFMILSVGLASQERSIWLETGLKRSGNNGYEEYLDAIDLFRKTNCSSLLSERGKAISPSDLQICRAIKEKMRPVIAKLESGNLKPVSDPRGFVQAATVFPEFAEFRNIASALQAVARVDFADGNSAAATRTLLLSLDVADRYGRFTLISGLISNASFGMALRSIDRHLGQISGSDAAKLEAWVNEYFIEPNAAAQSVRYEARSTGSILLKEISPTNPKELQNFFSDESLNNADAKSFQESWATASVAERKRLLEAVANKFQVIDSKLQQILLMPEKEWTTPELPNSEFAVDFLVSVFSVEYSGILDAYARIRTKFRLLRLHSAIRQYWYEHFRLPESLEKLNKPLYVLDPLAGENFVYEPSKNSSYELYSKGNLRLGRVELARSLERSGERTDPNRPPALPRNLAKHG